MTSLEKTYERYFEKTEFGCRVSIADIAQADSLLGAVFSAFHMNSDLTGKYILDLGCGLGCVAEALRRRGADVTAIDNSPTAIEHVLRSYPEVRAELAAFGPDYPVDRQYDIIWVRDFSLASTLDWADYTRNVLDPCLSLLNVDGCMILGLRSSFTGQFDAGNWANWPYAFVSRLKSEFAAEGPRVVHFANPFVSWSILQAARLMRRKIPFFMLIQQSAHAANRH